MKLLPVAVIACALAPAAALGQAPAPNITVAPPTGIKPQLQPVVVPGPTPVPKVVTAPPVTVTPPVPTGNATVFPKVRAVKPEQFPKSPAVFPKVPAHAIPKVPAVIPKAPAVRLTPLDEPRQGTASGPTDQQQLELQKKMQQQSQTSNTMSGVLKQQHDASKAIIQNTR